MLKVIIAFLLALFFTGCSSMKTSTDYDPNFSTAPLASYAIVHQTKEGEDTLGSDRIINAIHTQMQNKDYHEVQKVSADFYIDFQTHVQHDVPSNFSFGFGVGRYSNNVGISASKTTTPSSDQGTLLIMMIDPKADKIFWQVSAKDKLKSFKSPQERTAYINATVASMLKTFLHSGGPK